MRNTMKFPMEPNMIAKRADICKVTVRGASNNDCLNNNSGANYTLTAPSTIQNKAVTVPIFSNT